MDRLGTTSDGRVALDLRGLPGGMLDEPQRAEVAAALAAGGREQVARVFIVDAAIVDAWARMDAAGLVDVTGFLYRIGSRQVAIDQVLVAHATTEPPPVIDPALLWVLKSAGLGVRPFAIG